MTDERQNELDALAALDGLGEAPKTKSRLTAPKKPNREKKKEESHQHKEKKTKGPWLSKLLSGEMLKSESIQKNWGLILLLLGFGVLMVANRYHVENLEKKKEHIEEQVKYLNERKVQIQKQLQEQVSISNIAQALDSVGIKVISGPPYEL